jgi:hypothetical protein
MQLTNILLIVLFINLVVENVYPDKYSIFRETIIKPIIVNFGYNMIYCYSVIEIYINKIIGVTSYLKDKIIFFKQSSNILLEIYGEGKHIRTIELTNKNELKNINHDELIQHDFVILSEKTLDKNIVNKIHYNRLLTDLDYIFSTIKFMSINVTYNNNTYPIELKTDNYNYYIVNNYINSNFVKYYLTNMLNVKIDNDNFNYVISLIDHNVNFINLSHKDYIKILENDYEIIKSIDEENIVDDNKEKIVDYNKENILDEENNLALHIFWNNLLTDNFDDLLSDKSDDFVKLD